MRLPVYDYALQRRELHWLFQRDKLVLGLAPHADHPMQHRFLQRADGACDDRVTNPGLLQGAYDALQQEIAPFEP